MTRCDCSDCERWRDIFGQAVADPAPDTGTEGVIDSVAVPATGTYLVRDGVVRRAIPYREGTYYPDQEGNDV